MWLRHEPPRFLLNPARIPPPFGGTYTSIGLTDSWGVDGAVTTTGVDRAPDGSMTAARITEDATAAAVHKAYKQLTFSVLAQAYTFRVYVKQAISERNFQFALASSGFTSGANVLVNLKTGAAINTPFAFGSFSGASMSLVRVGRGWWRMQFGVTLAVDTSLWMNLQLADQLAVDLSTSPTYDGNGAGAISAWGFQIL